MSELREVRERQIINAAIAFEADRTTPKRDALFAAVIASKAPRFYVVDGTRVFLFKQGREIFVSDYHNPEVAAVIVERLNLDLDNGWVPTLN